MNITKALVCILVAACIISFTPDPNNLTVTLSLSKWQMIVNSLAKSTVVSANDANEITADIQEQVNKQFSDTTIKEKAPQKK